MSRKQEHEIVIDAPIEAVWKAIADGEELTRWFVEEATVEPGVGGKIVISWGGPEKGESRIEVWEPNKKLRVALRPEMGPLKCDPDTPIIDEYTLERRDGRTVLRLVSSGIPDSPDWDGFYNGTDSGWRMFFRTLRHYLEHHSGEPRTTLQIIGKLPLSLEDAWTRLTGPEGFGVNPIAGQAYATKTAAGKTLHGDVVFAKAPGQLELTMRELVNAYLAHSMSSAGGGQYVYTILSLYGKTKAEVDAIRAEWQPWLENAIGIETPGQA